MTKTTQEAQPKKTRKPTHPKVRCRAYKFRIYPTKKQLGRLEWTLRRCKELYNAALTERREAYLLCGVSVSYRMQAFFRRVMRGETPGYPRFKSGDRYDSFTYPQGGYEIIGNRLHLSKIGYIKIKLHREIKGKVKTCAIKREGEQWHAVFTSEFAFAPAMTFHPSAEAIGIDLGIHSFAVLSDGTSIENPRFYRHSEAKIKAAHQKIHRRKKGSHRRARAKQEVSRLYRKVRNRRRDFLHQESRKLVKRYAVLVFEDLPIENMTARPEPKQDESGNYLPNGATAKGGLNKSILDAGWGQFVTLCSRKAEEAGGTVVRVPPNDTSQQCSGCQRIVPKDLSVRWHSCPHCGTELDRDHNAALNILRRYREQKDGAGSAPQVSRVGYL